MKSRKRAIANAFAFRELGRRCNLAPRSGFFQCRLCSWSARLNIPADDRGLSLLEQHMEGHRGEPEQLALMVRTR